MSTPILKLRIVEITRETEDTATIHLQLPDARPVYYLPGQFLTLILPLQNQKVRRSYSLSSCFFEGPRLSVTVKRVAGGLVSNYLLDSAKVGDEIEALEPFGNFAFHTFPEAQRSVVLIGAGSGITPLLSILKGILHDEKQSKVYLIYGSRNEQNIIFKEKLKELEQQHPQRLKVVHVLSQPLQPDQHEHTGRLNRTKIIKLLQSLGVADFLDTLYFTCGPHGLMDEVKEALKILRVEPERIFKESFVSSKLTDVEAHGEVSTADTDDVANSPVEVTVSYEGSEYKFAVNPGQSILDAALEQNIDLPYSCQSGLCTACRGKCLSGKVHLDEKEGLSDAELKDGYVLTCVGHPLTKDVVIEIS